MGRGKKANIDLESMRKDYESGMRVTEIGPKYGVSYGFVYHHLSGIPHRGQKGAWPSKKAETSKRTPRTPRTPRGVSQIVEKETDVLQRQKISEVTEAIEAKGKELRSAQEEGKSKEASDVAAELNALEAELQELSEDSPFSEAAVRKVAGSTHKPVGVRSHTRRR